MLQRTAWVKAWVLCAAWIAAAPSYAADAPLMDALFSDHVVLQRDRPIPIWGRAAAGEEVIVTLSGATRSARANADGRWSLTMPDLPAGGPHTLTARTRTRMQNAHDVLVGDVWLCSGQSNMEWSVRGSLNSRAEIAASANDEIRHLRIAHASSITPRDSFDTPLEWKVAGPDTTADFSAVCYFFARDLAKTAQAPQGLVVAAWGGSKIQPWMSEAALEKLGGNEKGLDIARAYRASEAAGVAQWGEYWKTWWRASKPGQQPAEPWGVIRDEGDYGMATTAETPWESFPLDRLANYNGMAWYRAHVKLTAAQARQAATLSLGLVDEVDLTFVNGRAIGSSGCCPERSYAVPAGVLKAGDNIIAVNVLDTYASGGMYGPADKRFLQFADGSKLPVTGWRFADVPGPIPPRAPWEATAGLAVIYNAMIAPLGQYGLRGVVWYQGESNSTIVEGEVYKDQLLAMMVDWRQRFATPFPFLVVQLANYGARVQELGESGMALTREAQRRAVLEDGNAALAVTIDIGNPDDIHPTNKQEVGRRLALAARKLVYGSNAANASGMQPVSAKSEGGGTRVTFSGDPRLIVNGSLDPNAFQVCGMEQASCRFVRARVTGETAVTLESGEGAKPTRVRYCWADSPACNLYDSHGEPVGPFEIDIK